MKKDRELSVQRALSTLRAQKVEVTKDKGIKQPSGVGMGTWASIDCLCHYHGYHLISGKQ